jgi:hypothetical protein
MKTKLLFTALAISAALITAATPNRQTGETALTTPTHKALDCCTDPPCDTSVSCCYADGTLDTDPDPTGGIGDAGVTC